MLYEKLLSQVINIHFPENKFDLKGKLEWYPVTEKEKTRYLERTGKELKNQRRKYKITDVFWKKSADEEKISNSYYFNHILISEIEQNEIVAQAADRQEFLCQGQSLNIFFAAGASRSELHKVHYNAWQLGCKGMYYLRTETSNKAENVSTQVVRDALKDYETQAMSINQEECVACQG